jgi:hypothetical protein
MLERFVAHPVNKKKEKKSNHTEREPFFFLPKRDRAIGALFVSADATPV